MEKFDTKKMDYLDDLITCHICYEKFNQSLRKPLFLKCGHTFCQFCLKKIYKKPYIKCPFHQEKIEYKIFKDIPVNFQLQDTVLNTNEDNGEEEVKKLNEKRCDLHPTDIIRFFCQTCNELICGICLSEKHLNTQGEANHNIVGAQEQLVNFSYQQNMEKCQKKLNKFQVKLNEQKKQLIEELTKKEENFKKFIQNLKCHIDKEEQTIIQSILDDNIQLKKNIELKEQELQDLKEKLKNEQQENEQKQMKDLSDGLISDICDYSPELVSQSQINQYFKKIESCIFIPREFCDQILLEHYNKKVDNQLKAILDSFKNRDIIQSDLVYQTMVAVDRKNFVTDDISSNAYTDLPRPIGWGTTISAPSMHAYTLEKLYPFLIKGKKAIDIGTGSGYLACCFAQMMGKESKVIMLDHIQDILDFAYQNIYNNSAYFLKQNKIISVLQDGRKGFKDEAPYDVIHVGGALESIPQELYDQLAVGGRMWVPVGQREFQAIYIYDKLETGEIKQQKLMDVRYVSLTSVQDQLHDE